MAGDLVASFTVDEVILGFISGYLDFFVSFLSYSLDKNILFFVNQDD